MTELSLPARLATDSGAAELFVTTSAADVDDSFYQYLVPSVAAWFGIRRLVRAHSWGCRRIWDDALGDYRAIAESELLYPVIEVMPMGWSWGLHFCHESVSYLAASAARGVPGACPLLRERHPAPEPRPGVAALGVYVDNVYSIGISTGDSSLLVARFVDRASSSGVAVHWEHRDAEVADILGVEVGGGRGPKLLRNTARRTWRVHLAGLELARRGRAHPLEIQTWLGHFVHLCQLSRYFLSVPQVVYSWLQGASPCRQKLWPAVIEEILVCSRLVFAIEHVMDAPVAPLAYISDSSDHGFALLET